MNNLRLLTGLLVVALSGGGVRSYCQETIALEEIFESAERGSAQLKPSLTARSEAERDISVAKAAMLPDIGASLSLSYIGDGFTCKRNYSDYQKAPIPHFGNSLAFEINQPVYTGGALTNAVGLAEMKLTAARYASDFKRDNIRFRLTGFYLDIYKYTNLRKVVVANIVSARKVLGEMRARYEQGTALLNDITRYELLVSEFELQLVKIDNMLQILNTELVTIAGLPEKTVVVPDSTILLRSLPTDGEEWWQQEAEAHSPSLGLARSELGISQKAEKIVRSEMLPKIGLKAGWSIDAPILVEIPPINRNLSYWYVGVGVSYNLSSLYKSNKAVSKSRTATQRAAESLEATREDVSLAVSTDYVLYLEAYEELKTRSKDVQLAVQNYGTTSTRYMSGMALLTDMLDAANSRMRAEQQLVDARINIIYYYYKLLFTTGKI